MNPKWIFLANRSWLLALMALAACASPDKSAGGTVASPVEWRVAEPAAITIGRNDSDERYMFGRITGITFRPGGGLLIAESTPRLTLYDSTGTFVGRWGRRGSGPGEFRLIWHPPFRTTGDSVAVWDFYSRRLTLFDPNGNSGRTIAVAVPRIYWAPGTIPASDCCRVEHALSDGGFIMSFPGMIPTTPGPPRHSTVTLVRLDHNGAFRDTIGTFDDQWYESSPSTPDGARSFRMSGRFLFTTIGDTIFAGNGEGNMFLRVVPGAPADTVRLTGDPIPFTQELKDAFAAGYRARYAQRPTDFEGSVESLIEGQYASEVPAYVRMLSDDEGNIWLGQWSMPNSADSMVYRVVTSSGRDVATVKLPPQTSLHAISRGRLAVVVWDENDVQTVRVYELDRKAK